MYQMSGQTPTGNTSFYNVDTRAIPATGFRWTEPLFPDSSDRQFEPIGSLVETGLARFEVGWREPAEVAVFSFAVVEAFDELSNTPERAPVFSARDAGEPALLRVANRETALS